MSSSSITPEERYARIVEALVNNPDVTRSSDLPRSQRFGSSELRVKNRIFAILVKGKLVVKLPKPRVDALIAAGEGERFDPGHGRLVKEWVSITSSKLEWLPLAQEAMEYTASTR